MGKVEKMLFYRLNHYMRTMTMLPKRTAFFVSDRTGITAEMLGHSLLTQFDRVSFTEITLPSWIHRRRRRTRYGR